MTETRLPTADILILFPKQNSTINSPQAGLKSQGVEVRHLIREGFLILKTNRSVTRLLNQPHISIFFMVKIKPTSPASTRTLSVWHKDYTITYDISNKLGQAKTVDILQNGMERVKKWMITCNYIQQFVLSTYGWRMR